VPAALLNGQVVAPGQQFSFLQAVSPIDTAHGFAMGGVIIHGKSDHTGAIGGGICSASTTMFNAAARAGLQIDERHAHSYYINRYPLGLDATVYSNGYSAMDLKWTNDTPNPIVIRGRTTKGSKSTITIELWSLPLNRTVTFSPEYKSNVLKATDQTVYTTTIPVGQQVRAEYPTDGFDTSRTRTVTDAAGNVIHSDTWISKYIRVNGLLEIGHKATPTPPPSITPSPSGALVGLTDQEPARSPLRLS
jgi:vancomycin resistance protein YoaR